MTEAATPLPCAGSDHLTLLVDEVARASDRLRAALATTAGTDAGIVAGLRADESRRVAEATLRLDGGLLASPDGDAERAGTWLDALGEPEEATVADLRTLERAGVEAGLAASDLADAFGRSTADAGGLGAALAMLHGRLTAGLVADERAGRLRRGPRVVHDASVGRVLFFPTDPTLLPDAWDALLRHLTGTGDAGVRRPAAVRAAMLHLELLRHQPFDAANGRLARAASRLALLADGLLTDGFGTPDPVLAEDPLGYHEEVGASVRRRDATRWVERALEAQGAALVRARGDVVARTIGLGAGGAGAEPLPDVLPEPFTLADVVEVAGGSNDDARERCSDWVLEGRAERVVGSAGLRLRRPLRRAG